MPRNPLIALALVLFASFAFGADRDAAEWTIRKHGRVMLNGDRQPIA